MTANYTRHEHVTTPTVAATVEVAVAERVTLNNDRLAAASTIKVNEGKNPWKDFAHYFFVYLSPIFSSDKPFATIENKKVIVQGN